MQATQLSHYEAQRSFSAFLAMKPNPLAHCPLDRACSKSAPHQHLVPREGPIRQIRHFRNLVRNPLVKVELQDNHTLDEFTVDEHPLLASKLLHVGVPLGRHLPFVERRVRPTLALTIKSTTRLPRLHRHAAFRKPKRSAPSGWTLPAFETVSTSPSALRSRPTPTSALRSRPTPTPTVARRNRIPTSGLGSGFHRGRSCRPRPGFHPKHQHHH